MYAILTLRMLLTLNQEKCWHQMSPQHVFNGHLIVQKFNHQDHVPGLLLNSNQQQLVWGPRTALVAPYHPQCPTNAQNANTAHKCMGCTLGKRKHECRFPHPSRQWPVLQNLYFSAHYWTFQTGSCLFSAIWLDIVFLKTNAKKHMMPWFMHTESPAKNVIITLQYTCNDCGLS